MRLQPDTSSPATIETPPRRRKARPNYYLRPTPHRFTPGVLAHLGNTCGQTVHHLSSSLTIFTVDLHASLEDLDSSVPRIPNHVSRCSNSIGSLLHPIMQHLLEDLPPEEGKVAGEEGSRREAGIGNTATRTISTPFPLFDKSILGRGDCDGPWAGEEECE